MNKRSHDPSIPADVPTLTRPAQKPEHRDNQEARLAHARTLPPLRGSAEPQPSQFAVDLSQAPRDSQTGASVADVMKTTAVPPKGQTVDIEASDGPSYLRHGR